MAKTNKDLVERIVREGGSFTSRKRTEGGVVSVRHKGGETVMVTPTQAAAFQDILLNPADMVSAAEAVPMGSVKLPQVFKTSSGDVRTSVVLRMTVELTGLSYTEWNSLADAERYESVMQVAAMLNLVEAPAMEEATAKTDDKKPAGNEGAAKAPEKSKG